MEVSQLKIKKEILSMELNFSLELLEEFWTI